MVLPDWEVGETRFLSGLGEEGLLPVLDVKRKRSFCRNFVNFAARNLRPRD